MTKVTFKTYGCSNNFAESEVMAGILDKDGHKIVDDDKADVIVFNMCSVKGPSVNHALNQMKKIKKDNPNKKIIVAGCVPKHMVPTIREIDDTASIMNTHHIDQITKVVESSETKELVSYAKKVKLNFPRRRKNPIISIVPILSGCNDHCTYCYTKLVKGPTFSYPSSRIVKEVEDSVKEGCKEIWLTSQDNGAYMTDQGNSMSLPQLVKEIVKVEGDFFVRIGMTNPTYIPGFIDELIEVLKHPKVYKFVHIPVQAGNNRILSEMKRRYTAEEYKEIVSKLKEAIPSITVDTDIICGFPGETEEEFEDTMKLISETKPNVLNISRFQPRPGTKAAKMIQILSRDVKQRTRKLTSYFHSYALEQKKPLIGKELKIMINEHGKKGNDSIGRDEFYRQVVVKEKLPLGKMVTVKIIDADKFYLIGEIVK